MSAPTCVVPRPALAYPEHRISLAQMLDMAERIYGGEPHFPLIRRMIANTKIEQRRLAIELDALDEPRGLARRNEQYMELALPLAREVATQALAEAGLEARDIDLVITTSCTGFVMPSLDAYLMTELGFSPHVRRMPLAQLGCVAGASALVKAHDHCRAYPDARVLIVAVELSSLCFFPERKDLSSGVCASIFGDGAAACIVSGADHRSRGLGLDAGLTYTAPGSEHYIRYDILDQGYHLTLDRAVMHAVPKLAPMIREFLAAGSEDPESAAIDFVVAHTGGRRIIDGLGSSLALEPEVLDDSRASLREFGNTASVSIFDVLDRAHSRQAELEHTDNLGLVIAFGPGFSMELLRARWWNPLH